MNRLNNLGKQLQQTATSKLGKSDDDVVIVRYDFLRSLHPFSAVRTPICRARKGGLKDALPEDMLAVVLKVAAPTSYMCTGCR